MEHQSMAAMNLLFLVHNPNNPHSGAVRIYHNLTTGLRERGHRVRILHLEDYNLPRNTSVNLLAQRLALPNIISHTAGRLDLSGVDVIMSSSGMAAPLFRRLRCRAVRPLLVNHIHGLYKYDHVANLSEKMLGHWPVSWGYRMVTGPFQVRWDAAGIAFSDHTAVQNLRDLSEVHHMLHGRAEATLIPASIHPKLLAASREVVCLGARPAGAILYFGTWESRKGSFYIPAAFRAVRQSRPEATLTIGGTGMPAGAILSQFDPQDCKNVTIMPHLSNEDHIRVMNQHAIFLFPSLSEGFGLALLEALCFGLAGVTTNTGFGADYLMDGVSAKIVFPTSEQIARALLTLIENPEQRCTVGAAGRAVARLLTPDRAVDSYEHLFRNLASRPLASGLKPEAA